MATTAEATAIEKALSIARFSTYRNATAAPDKLLGGLDLYVWNAEVSAALLIPLSVCEVAIRNAVAEALEAVYGQHWPWSTAFENDLSQKPRDELIYVSDKHPTTGKVVADMSFYFWEGLFVQSFDQTVWQKHLKKVFPNVPVGMTFVDARKKIKSELFHLRSLRNRIAHHEPLLAHPTLQNDAARMCDLVEMRCRDTAAWLRTTHRVDGLVAAKPI